MSIANYLAEPQEPTSYEQMNDHDVVLRVLPGGLPARPTLSLREIEVLLAWLGADSKAQAAEELFITASTVNTHLTRIRAKYAASGRPARSKANLFARAIQDGYTRLEDW